MNKLFRVLVNNMSALHDSENLPKYVTNPIQAWNYIVSDETGRGLFQLIDLDGGLSTDLLIMACKYIRDIYPNIGRANHKQYTGGGKSFDTHSGFNFNPSSIRLTSHKPRKRTETTPKRSCFNRVPANVRMRSRKNKQAGTSSINEAWNDDMFDTYISWAREPLHNTLSDIISYKDPWDSSPDSNKGPRLLRDAILSTIDRNTLVSVAQDIAREQGWSEKETDRALSSLLDNPNPKSYDLKMFLERLGESLTRKILAKLQHLTHATRYRTTHRDWDRLFRQLGPIRFAGVVFNAFRSMNRTKYYDFLAILANIYSNLEKHQQTEPGVDFKTFMTKHGHEFLYETVTNHPTVTNYLVQLIIHNWSPTSRPEYFFTLSLKQAILDHIANSNSI